MEDAHWADEATLDLLRLLGRRIEALRTLLIGTFRDDEIDSAHPLRVVLGDIFAETRHFAVEIGAAQLFCRYIFTSSSFYQWWTTEKDRRLISNHNGFF